MKSLTLCLLAALGAPVAFGAVGELNVADGTIESPDGLFIGRDFTVVDGFKLELLHVATPDQGQWVALDWDDQGRLLVPAYNSDRLARLTIPNVGSTDPVRVEMITTTQVGAAEGILNAFGGIYLNANRSQTMRSGMYKITDSNGDGVYDTTSVIRNRQGSGDHGTHTLQLTPDGQMITMISGNATNPTVWTRSRVPQIWGEDNLVMRMDLSPPGFHRAPEAHLDNFSPDGSIVELWSMGMRNPVSHAYNKDGELFVYDADEEPNMGFTVGYRPTPIIHAISGSDAGWRSGSKVHPYWRFDFHAPIGDVGSGSPVGSAFGTGTKFPAQYQDAFFIADWSFGNLWATFITPNGSSYSAEAMPFVSGRPFAVSGIIPNPRDGSLIVMTTGTQLYRVTYVGNESTAATQPDSMHKPFRDIRHSLEAFHGAANPRAVEAAWPHLSNPDRAIRYAARTALEWQPVASWRERALAEPDARRAIAAIASLARVSARDDYHTAPNSGQVRDKALQTRMLAALNRIDWNRLTYQDRLDLVRAYQLTMIRLGMPEPAAARDVIARLDPQVPFGQMELDRELAEVLVYLQAPSAATKVMALLRNDSSAPYYGIKEWINPQQRQRQDRGDVTGPNIGVPQAMLARQDHEIFYAQLLRTLTSGWTPELRREYLTFFTTNPTNYFGSMNGLRNIHADAIAMVPESERAGLQDLIGAELPAGRGRGLPGSAAANAAAAGGGRGRGGLAGTPGFALEPVQLYQAPGGSNRAFNDVEVTALTRFDERVRAQILAQSEAAEALVAASLAVPANPATISARVQALGAAELALANARADNFRLLRAEISFSPEQLAVLPTAMNVRGGRGTMFNAAAAAAPAAPARGGLPAGRGGD
jgi:hypothetical protein